MVLGNHWGAWNISPTDVGAGQSYYTVLITILFKLNSQNHSWSIAIFALRF